MIVSGSQNLSRHWGTVAPPCGPSIDTYTCQAFTLGSVKALGTYASLTYASLTYASLTYASLGTSGTSGTSGTYTVAPKTALSLTRCRLPHLGLRRRGLPC